MVSRGDLPGTRTVVPSLRQCRSGGRLRRRGGGCGDGGDAGHRAGDGAGDVRVRGGAGDPGAAARARACDPARPAGSVLDRARGEAGAGPPALPERRLAGPLPLLPRAALHAGLHHPTGYDGRATVLVEAIQAAEDEAYPPRRAPSAWSPSPRSTRGWRPSSGPRTPTCCSPRANPRAGLRPAAPTGTGPGDRRSGSRCSGRPRRIPRSPRSPSSALATRDIARCGPSTSGCGTSRARAAGRRCPREGAARRNRNPRVGVLRARLQLGGSSGTTSPGKSGAVRPRRRRGAAGLPAHHGLLEDGVLGGKMLALRVSAARTGGEAGPQPRAVAVAAGLARRREPVDQPPRL